MIPLGSFVTLEQSAGPNLVMRYNGYPTAEITGAPAPGYSSGQAQALIEEIADRELPNGLSYEWTELAYQELIAGNTGIWVFPLCVLLAFLVLAAQYESWTLPLVVILIVPMTLLSAIVGVWLSGGDNNIFTQIGLIVLVGLACKNAILIVEFARTREGEGASTWDAVIEACKLRLRPILMTSIAFIAGVVPLVLSTGAGSEMRNAMGVAVFAGMIGVTVFGLMLTPVFYWVVRRAAVTARAALGRRAAVAAAALLSACAVGPDYRPPETPPAEFVRAGAAEVAQEPFEVAWWEQFRDPVLSDLVARALSADLDLRVAAARVTEARALLGGAARARWPLAAAEVARDERKAQQPGFTDQRIDAQSYQAGIATLWELDLFGRVRRGVEAAAAEADAAEADLHDAQVLVAAEVASAYLELRGAQRRLEVARANLDSQRETLELTRVRLDLGRGSELDVASAAARFAAIQASIPPLVALEAISAHRLAVLIGERPGTLETELVRRELPSQLTTIAVGSPEALLKRRPDIRAAERELAAETARIGIAKADLFPQLTVGGFIGFIAGDADELGESTSRAWSVTPVLSWAGLDGGRARLAAAEARADGALALYERAVLLALEETENAFVTYGQNRHRLVAAVEQATASQRAAELARVQYREGALDFLRLLDAERTQLEAEDAVVVAETDLNTSVVLIYKALGGGWEAAPLPAS
jgi:multidrug efflux system outer membrane protein